MKFHKITFLRNLSMYGNIDRSTSWGKIKKGCYFFDELVENRQTVKSTDYCGLGPIRGQLVSFVTLTIINTV